jgi:hypothetical protein
MKRLPSMMRRSLITPACWLHGVLVSLVLSTGPAGTAYAFGSAAMTLPGQIALQDGKLTAHLTAAPLHQVMEEVSRLSGAQVRWLSSQEEKLVSVEFHALPFPEALRRILGETNFLLFYVSEGMNTKLTQIWISSKEIGREPSEFIHLPASQRENTTERQAAPDAMSVDTLIQTAVSALDPFVRVEAIARLGEHAPADPKVEGILSHLASNDSSPQVRAAASEVLAGIE